MQPEHGMALCVDCPARRPLAGTINSISEAATELVCPTQYAGEPLCEVYGVVFHWPDGLAHPDEVQNIRGVVYGYCWLLNAGEGGYFVQSYDQPIVPLPSS
jgi:hypothetical protein